MSGSDPAENTQHESEISEGCNVPRWRVLLALAGAFFSVLGLRLALIVRFGSHLPMFDEWGFYDSMNAWHSGQHNLLALFEAHGQHYPFMSRLSQVLTLQANGLWEPRFQSVVLALLYSVYALVTLSVLARAVGPCSSLKVIGIGCFFFFVPFAGFRVTWSFLDGTTYMMLFSVVSVYLVVYRPWGLASEIVAAALTFLAAFSMGSGCLLAFAMAAFLGVRRLVERRLFWSEVALALCCIAIFAIMMVKVSGGARGSMGMDLKAIAVTFLSSLAWPTVFFWPAGLLAFLPFLIVAFQFARGQYRDNHGVAFVVLLGLLIVMQCAAIGVLRSDNEGMPSNRYNDILLLAPLVNLCCLLFLVQPKQIRGWICWLRLAWVILMIAGSSANILWRTWPFLARENGEWYDWAKQRAVRLFAETGDERLIPNAKDGKLSENVEITDARQLQEILIQSSVNSVLTEGSIVGVNLQLEAGTTGFKEDGFPPEYYAHPAFRYWGSYTEKRELATGELKSQPFVAHTPYLVFDIIVYKKSRFNRYALDGLSLSIIDLDTGSETQLLSQLRSRFPFVLRDREHVYTKVRKGHRYIVKARDDSPSDWFAFSQPFEAGNLTWLTQTLLDSGKLMLFLGILAFAFILSPKMKMPYRE